MCLGLQAEGLRWLRGDVSTPIQEMPRGFSLRNHLKNQGVTTEVALRAHMLRIQKLMAVNPSLRPHTYVVPKNGDARQRIIVDYIKHSKGS